MYKPQVMAHDSRPLQAHGLEWILRALASFGLGASALLLWDYSQPAPLFCASGEGCDAVRLSWWAVWGGIPMPVFGVAGFGVALALVLTRGGWAGKAFRWAAWLGGVAGVGLFLLQAVEIGAFCVYCVMVDIAAVALALFAWGRRQGAPPMTARSWLTFAAVFAVAFGLPFGVGRATHPARAPVAAPVAALPAGIRDMQQPGVVTIVEFFDFECPHCRAQHFTLARLLEGRAKALGKPVRVVRKHLPLPYHRNAKLAARVAICAEESGHGEIMIDLLFASDDLSPAALEASARQLGMDVAELRACVSSAATTRRLEDDARDAQRLGIAGLPTYFVGGERFEGLQREDLLFAAMQRAAGDADSAATSGHR